MQPETLGVQGRVKRLLKRSPRGTIGKNVFQVNQQFKANQQYAGEYVGLEQW